MAKIFEHSRTSLSGSIYMDSWVPNAENTYTDNDHDCDTSDIFYVDTRLLTGTYEGFCLGGAQFGHKKILGFPPLDNSMPPPH